MTSNGDRNGSTEDGANFDLRHQSPVHRYAVGSLIRLRESHASTSACQLELEIKKHIRVSNYRISQVVLVETKCSLFQGVESKRTYPSEGSTLIAKIYDPQYASVDENCKGGS